VHVGVYRYSVTLTRRYTVTDEERERGKTGRRKVFLLSNFLRRHRAPYNNTRSAFLRKTFLTSETGAAEFIMLCCLLLLITFLLLFFNIYLFLLFYSFFFFSLMTSFVVSIINDERIIPIFEIRPATDYKTMYPIRHKSNSTRKSIFIENVPMINVTFSQIKTYTL